MGLFSKEPIDNRVQIPFSANELLQALAHTYPDRFKDNGYKIGEVYKDKLWIGIIGETFIIKLPKE